MGMCPNNQRGYDVRHAAARPYCDDGAQVAVELGTRDRLNGRERKVTRFHETNIGSCESVQMLSDGQLVGGLATVSDEVFMVVLGLGLEANESTWA